MKNTIRSGFAYFIISAVLALPRPAFPETKAPAYYQEHCVDCHSRITGGDGSVLYHRKDGIVGTQTDLEQRIAFYVKELDLEWNSSQVQQIVDYLNRSYYRFQQVQ